MNDETEFNDIYACLFRAFEIFARSGSRRAYLASGKQFIWLIIATAVLNGCQSIRNPYLGESVEKIETHRFAVDDTTQVIGEVAVFRAERADALPDVARHFGLGFNDISIANPSVDIWLPKPGTPLLLPGLFVLPDAPRQGIVLNLASMRLFYFLETDAGSRQVSTFPIGIGRTGWATPTGAASIIYKYQKPTWYVPATIREEHANKSDPLPAIVPPGPENPLGEYAMGLSIKGYLIHGTNKPFGVGMRISHGCVRLYPEDIEYLYGKVGIGAPVNIVNQPYLIGWRENQLYLEVHKPDGENPKQLRRLRDDVITRIEGQAEKTGRQVDWRKVEQALERNHGIPVPILTKSPSLKGLFQHAVIVKHPKSFIGEYKVPPLRSVDWSLESNYFERLFDAERLAVVLNHEGPPIPSRVTKWKQGFKVLVGPFRDAVDAEKASKRIARELGIEVRLRKPESVAKSYTP